MILMLTYEKSVLNGMLDRHYVKRGNCPRLDNDTFSFTEEWHLAHYIKEGFQRVGLWKKNKKK